MSVIYQLLYNMHVFLESFNNKNVGLAEAVHFKQAHQDHHCSVVLLTQSASLIDDMDYFPFTNKYEGCSNINASSFIAFFTYVLRQNGKRIYKGLYVTFKLAQILKKNTACSTSYSPSNEGHVSILTNSMLRTYTSDIDGRIILQ